MVKGWLLGLALALVLLVGEAPASPLAQQDVVIPMDDGVPIAATLHLPDASAPSGGWPAIVLLHGLPGDRAQMNMLVSLTGLAAQGYAVLTFDARGVGGSGGLVSVAGPREVADVRALHAWLDARGDVAGAKIAALGISYGGGIALNSLVAGVPWKAVFVAQTWTDLSTALAPQGLVKTGALASYLAAIPPARRDPSLTAAAAAALAGNTAAVRQWAAERSSLTRLDGVSTPVFMAQGRRDFLFGIDQGTLAFPRLRGTKVLYLGLHGHAPSTFPAADTGTLLQLGSAWLGCHLRDVACDPAPQSVYIAPENFTGQVTRRGTLPPTSATTVALPGVSTFGQRGKGVRRGAPLRSAIEVFGSPTVTTTIVPSGGWSRLVAVLTARTPQGKEIVIGSGGVPTRTGSRKVTIRLSSQATFIPRGSRLTLTLASSSTAQASSNTLYVDLPMPPTARARVGTAVLRLPALRTPVTR
ncbi:MAG: alpha/beta fold hydrolase [Gaiellaceae bacterium]